jgi:hypothetical protein
MLDNEERPTLRGAEPVANDEHLALLRQGTATWNEWWERNPGVVPDLEQAELRGTETGFGLHRLRLAILCHLRCSVSKDFQIIELQIDKNAIKRLTTRERNQLVGCLHAHNELTVLNRLLMCTIEYPEDANELHNSAQSVQLWCLLQVLIGKIFETWKMLRDRFLGCNPVDPIVAALSPEHRYCLAWLSRYFASKDNALATIRDKAAFHYDKLNTERALSYIAPEEDMVYLAQQPINTVYYLGSSLVFRTLFTMISDNEDGVAVGSRKDRTKQGLNIAIRDASQANVSLHRALYGLIEALLEKAEGKPLHALKQDRIDIKGAPDPDTVRLPLFLDIPTSTSQPPVPQVVSRAEHGR